MSLKETAITVAVAVLFTTFVLVAIDAFYPRPQYADFCKQENMPIVKAAPPGGCNYTQESEEQECYSKGGIVIFNYSDSCPAFKECSFCNALFDKASAQYNNNLFLLLAPLGAIAIIAGVLFGVEFIGSGFMYSGVALMFFGTVQNFGQLNKYLKVIVVFIELILVLFIAYRKLIPLAQEKEDKPGKPRK